MAEEDKTVDDGRKTYNYRGQEVRLNDAERDALLDRGITEQLEGREKEEKPVEVDEQKDEAEADAVAKLSAKLDTFVGKWEADKSQQKQDARRDEILAGIETASKDHDFTKDNPKARAKVEKLALQELSANPHADITKLFKKQADELAELSGEVHTKKIEEKRATKEKTLTPGKGSSTTEVDKNEKPKERVTSLRGFAKKHGLNEKLSASKDKTLEGRKEVFN